MTRQAFTRILLSLLLLMSQQMAATHAMSHWSTRLGGAQGGTVQALSLASSLASPHKSEAESDLSRAFALDQTCDQCLAFAHMVGPLGHTPRTFAPPDLVGNAVLAAAGQPACARTLCAFRSRAPPLA